MGIENLSSGLGTALGAVAPALQVVGAGASALGAFKSSQNNQAAYKAQAQVAQNNALIAGWQAQDALVRGDRAAQTSRSKTRQLKGTQRAALAANGVDLGEGSALNILTDTDYFGAVDAGTIKDNAAREAWVLRNQATGYSAEAGMLKDRASDESPWMAAGTSLLTSAGKVASNWYTPASADYSAFKSRPGGNGR